MPLSAQVDGVSVNAAILSDTEWQALKGSRYLRMPCCDTRGYARTGRLGTRHFVHSPGSHCGAEGESTEHLAAKAEIVRACHELGWEVQSEFIGENWRADVYTTRGRHRVAFEVQWSPQTLELTRTRHALYGTDVKCCWLFRKPPLPIGQGYDSYVSETLADATLPMFRLSLTESGFIVEVDHRHVSLREFVQARLKGRIRFCDKRRYTSREVQLTLFKEGCPRHSTYHAFYTTQILRSQCGAKLSETDPGEKGGLPNDPHSALRNLRLAKNIFSKELKSLRVSVKRRWSKTLRKSYWCFGCPECNWFLGDHFFLLKLMEDEGIKVCSQPLPHSETLAERHWCFPQNGSFCAREYGTNQAH